jgi:hypothetical protein
MSAPKMETTLNDTVDFSETRDKEFTAGNKYEIEIGNCAVSEFAWFRTETEARAAHSLLEAEWTKDNEDGLTLGEIEYNSIRLLGTNEEYGFLDEDRNEDLHNEDKRK